MLFKINPPATVDTRASAEKTYEVFHARPVPRRRKMDFAWPSSMQEVGRGRAVMYRSNKWKRNLKDWEDYKHVAEAWQTVYVTPGFLVDWWRPAKKIQVHGPVVKLESPMPQHFAILAPIVGVQVQLFGKGGKIAKGENIYEVTVPHATLGAAEHPKTKETILFVYTKHGVHVMFTGPELDIGKDGVEG